MPEIWSRPRGRRGVAALAVVVALVATGCKVDGTDPSFGTNGIVTTKVAPYSHLYDVAVAPGAKIVAVGSVSGTAGCQLGCFGVVRYNTDGKFDTSFSGDGKASFGFGDPQRGDTAVGAVVQPNAKIVVAGELDGGEVLVRLTANGAVDTSFGNGGVVSVLVGAYFADLALQSDGKIVVAGYTRSTSDSDIVVERYLATGVPDTSFDSDGRVTASVDKNDDVYSVAIQPNGKIVVGGNAYDTSVTPQWNWRWFLTRFNGTNGAIDTSFGQGGTVTILPYGTYFAGTHLTDVAVQTNGKVFAVGEAAGSGTVVARFDTLGRPDRTWGATGVVHGTADPGARFWTDQGVAAAAIGTDGNLITVGPAGSCYCPWTVVHWNADGTYQTPTHTETPASRGTEFLGGLAVQADGKIVVGAGQFNLARYPAQRGTPTIVNPDAGQPAKPVESFAPVVYLYTSQADTTGDPIGSEPYLPMNADNFIYTSDLNASSRLKWAAGANCPADQLPAEFGTGIPQRLKLGHGAYSHTAEDDNCQPTGPSWNTNDFTRPYSGSTGDQGFFLQHSGSVDGSLSAPTYYSWLNEHVISYWFFYGFDKFDTGIGSPPLPQEHQGDWENIAIRLNCNDQPIEVAYYAHGNPDLLNWPGHTNDGVDAEHTITLENGHPVVYSGRGTHASYATPGDHDLPITSNPDKTDRGLAWHTYDNLAGLTAQPWYGYQGAWGAVTYVIPDELAAAGFSDSDFSGPLGPNPANTKELAPSDWFGDCVP